MYEPFKTLYVQLINYVFNIRCERHCPMPVTYETHNASRQIQIMSCGCNKSAGIGCVPCQHGWAKIKNYMSESSHTVTTAQQTNSTGPKEPIKATESSADSLQVPGYVASSKQTNSTGPKKPIKATESSAGSFQVPGYVESFHTLLKCFISEETECAAPTPIIPYLTYQSKYGVQFQHHTS